MRNYQPQKTSPYILPHNLYMQVLYLIRDYDRLKKEYHDIIDETPFNDGQPRSGGITDTTAKKAVKIASISDKLASIEQSLILIPMEYRSHVFNNIVYGVIFPDYANRNTWSIYRCRFIHHVAKNMKWL